MSALDGKAALVTGASRGIGLAIAQALAREGARVALLARGAEPLEEARSAVGERAIAITADVGDADSVRRAFGAVEEAFGRLDILVNNAAVAPLGRLEDLADDDLEAAVRTNLLGALHCARAAIPLLRRSGGGDIVNVSSEAVLRPFPFLAVYGATKAGVEALTTALRSELRADGIRLTLLRSGAVVSPGLALGWDPERSREAFRVWREEGILSFMGNPMSPQVVADGVVHAVTRPAGASVDVMEIRAAKDVLS